LEADDPHEGSPQADAEGVKGQETPFTNPSLDPSLPFTQEERPYVETIDGLGYRTGNVQEHDGKVKVGVVSLKDGRERFYWPRMVLSALPQTIEAYKREVLKR
jgi:hypothetical protein